MVLARTVSNFGDNTENVADNPEKHTVDCSDAKDDTNKILRSNQIEVAL